MNTTADRERFRLQIEQFQPGQFTTTRCLALYAAAIALADDTSLDAALDLGKHVDIPPASYYELVLQSYLFLGFPRMLTAAEHLDGRYKIAVSDSQLKPVSQQESEEWFDRGLALCRRVYAENYDRLKERVELMAPEIFRWMVFEGYGKVLSRPGLSIVDRELAVIASLMMENRPKQLLSHLLGAVHVGAGRSLIRLVIDDIGPAAGDGYLAAVELAGKLDKN